jgi:ATP-dependent HslUV protease, peptidase subunit HslV
LRNGKDSHLSTIVIVKKANKVVVGADTLHTQGSITIRNIYQSNTDKIFRHGKSYIGVVGSSAFYHLLPSLFKKHNDLVNLNSSEDIFETLIRIHPILKDEYYIDTNENDDDTQEFESNQIFALIANKTGAYEIQSYREVHAIETFWAIGSGKCFALGAMHAIFNTEENPRRIAETGLKAACDFDEASGMPLFIKSVNLEK